MKSMQQFLKEWYSHFNTRMGQYFVNTYYEGAWPELYYEKDNGQAFHTIQSYLKEKGYENELPPRIGQAGIEARYQWVFGLERSSFFLTVAEAELDFQSKYPGQLPRIETTYITQS